MGPHCCQSIKRRREFHVFSCIDRTGLIFRRIRNFWGKFCDAAANNFSAPGQWNGVCPKFPYFCSWHILEGFIVSPLIQPWSIDNSIFFHFTGNISDSRNLRLVPSQTITARYHRGVSRREGGRLMRFFPFRDLRWSDGWMDGWKTSN